jgi:NADH-quinone oxidoreductase subunit N
MTALDWQMLLPYGILAGTAVILTPLTAFLRSRSLAASIACVALVGTIIACIAVSPLAPRSVTPLFTIDRFALYFICLIALCSFGAALLARDYFSGSEAACGEFFIFILLSTFGAATIVSSAHFVSLFLGLEILNVSFYVLIAWRKLDAGGIEAALKYLIPGAVGGAFLLFGMALVNAELGTMKLSSIMSRFVTPGTASLIVTSGIALIMVGIGFKLALVPFHLWTADIYQGAPVPVAMLVATVSKAAVFALFMRYFYPILALHIFASSALTAMAVVSMIFGNLLALRQENLKRILAYSSIAHMGYFVSAFLGGGRFGVIAATYYLTAYAVTIIVAFGALSMLSINGKAETIDDIRSLSIRSPWLAGAFTIACASLAGLPLLAGFFGKFYVLAAIIHSGTWISAAALVVTSGIGIYYYFRIISAMFERSEKFAKGTAGGATRSAPLSVVVLSLAVIAVIVLGTLPAPLTGLIALIVGR